MRTGSGDGAGGAAKVSLASSEGPVARLRLMAAHGLILRSVVSVMAGLIVAGAEEARAEQAPTPQSGAPVQTAGPANTRVPADTGVPAKSGATAKTGAPAGKRAPLLPVGANEIMKLTAEAGFVDDVVAYDNGRVAYVVADTATKAELHVVQFGCTTCIAAKQEIVVDLSPVTLRPVALRLMGQRAFVVGTTADGNQVGALIELAKKTATPVYKVGPAAHVSVIARDGATRVAVHKTTATKTGTRHEVELFAVETGKRVAAGKPSELDKDHHKKLDFRVNHWSDGWTRVSGLKGGEWNRKENIRGADSEATYDLVTGAFVENKPIADVVEQRKRYQTLAEAGGRLELVRMTWDNNAVVVWTRGQPRTIELDQSIQTYDPKSLQGIVAADGSAWIALKVDPVNADAVARKKADPEYLDLFRVGAGETKAVRKGRIPSKGVRLTLGAFDGYVWLLERSTSFDRGGRSITIYQLP